MARGTLHILRHGHRLRIRGTSIRGARLSSCDSRSDRCRSYSRGRVGWAAAFYAVLLSLFVALPLSAFWIQTVWGFTLPFVWLHIITLLILISPLGFNAPKWIRSSNGVALALGVGVTILAATMAQHVTGGILYETILFPVIHVTTLSRATFFWSLDRKR